MTASVMTAPVATPAPPAEAPPVTDLPSARFPSVNLLPDSVRQSIKARHARLVVLLVAGLAVTASLGLYAVALLDVSDAREGYEASVATGDALAREAQKYAEVPRVTAQLQAAQKQQASAMSTEVRWSTVLANLAGIMPPGVSLTELRGSLASTPATAKGAASQQRGAQQQAAASGVGSMTFAGEAVAFPSVARWLDVLGKQPIYASPYATTMQRESGGTAAQKAETLTFSSSADLTEKALSHRFDSQGTVQR